MTIIVQKYGGVCLETPAKVKAVAMKLAELHRQSYGVVVVVSAMGKATDELIRLAYEVSAHPNRRELDMLLTTGERVSMSLLGMALNDLGVPAISFTGSQAGVLTDSSHSNARIVDVRPIRVEEELAKGKVIVLAGFQGVHSQTKEITTLGRGGSDTTAVAMASRLRAERCEIIKEVDGVCSADPHLVKNARTFRELGYRELLDMCFWGAKVLHYRSVELAQQTQVNLVIRRWGHDQDATIIKHEVNMEEGKVLAVNSLARIEHLEISAANLSEAYDALDKHLQTHRLPWPQILASTYEGSSARLMFTGDTEALDTLFRTASNSQTLKPLKSALASVSVTCHGAVATALPDRILKSLAQQNIRVEKLLVSPMTVTVCVAQMQRDQTVQILHGLVE